MTPAQLAQTIRERIAMNVMAQRAKLGLSQSQAAERCSMSVRVYQRIETANTNLGVSTIAAVCFGLGIGVEAVVQPTRRLVRRKPGRPPQPE